VSIAPEFQLRVKRNEPMSRHTSWHVGGPAEVFFNPRDLAELSAFLRTVPPAVPIYWIGLGSNLLVRDGGLPGVVISTHGTLDALERSGATSVRAGAGTACARIARECIGWGLGPAEFFAGIPGTLGGGLRMNAGAYGGDIAGCLDWAELVTRAGETVRLSVADLALAYRYSNVPPGSVVVRARLRATPGEPVAIAARMAEIRSRRESTQPVRSRTGGSTFRNPSPDQSSLAAWELIDAAGCRGLKLGAAQVSELHCNFLINTGGATAADLEGLGEEVRRRVLATSGVVLEWEIRRIGIPALTPEVSP